MNHPFATTAAVVAFLGLLLLSPKVDALPHYADLIPNGHSVPNPEIPGNVWAGVGHTNAGGGGENNPFGLDFAQQGHVWTQALCKMDSDGDGRTNGVELGDPECTWIAGDDGGDDNDTDLGPALSHPGIVDEPQDAALLASTCADFVEPERVDFLEIQFTQINTVDASPTHYTCEQFEYDVPTSLLNSNNDADGDADVYHLIKSEILLDNPDLLHHMFVYFCPEDTDSSDGNRVGDGPYDCYGRTENNCLRIGGWAVGARDFCYPQQVGMELALQGSTKLVVKIEAHYDNTMGVPQTDQSGMKFTITPDLRPLSSSQVTLGMATMDNDFSIPPQTEEHVLTNICPSEVTLLLEHPIYAFSYAPHMHTYGNTLYTEQWRCGKKLGELGRIDNYDFDNQQAYSIPQPTKILPGDALVTKCHFNTVGEDTVIVGGEETKDEMCFDFVNYYPHAGTEMQPTLFSTCLTFLNGIKGFEDNPTLQNIRLAIPDRMSLNPTDLILDFEDDPTNSWAPCCDIGDCEEQYKMLATVGAACGMNNDCAHGLSCVGGVCSDPLSKEDEDENDPVDDATQADDSSDGAAQKARMLMLGSMATVMSLLFA
ncbi:MAG: hypothetical protein SGARI_001289 [Bacillariaceae sp.]